MDKFESSLPTDFDGIFRFTNATNEDFTGKWGGKAYTYPANKRSPMVIVDASPIEIQNIRKKFARELAEREFFKSKKAKQMTEKRGELNSIHQAATYSDSDLRDLIQQCLEPLPTAQASITIIPKDNIEDRLSRDDEGELRTVVVDKGASLVEGAKRGRPRKVGM